MKMDNRSYYDGKRDGIWLYAWWKDGIQYVGTTGTTLAEAWKEVDEEERIARKANMKNLDKTMDAIAKQETF